MPPRRERLLKWGRVGVEFSYSMRRAEFDKKHKWSNRMRPAFTSAAFLLFTIVAAVAQDAAAPKDTAAATKAIEKSIAAYRSAPGLVDTMTINITLPGGQVQSVDVAYALGGGTDAHVELPPLSATSKKDRFYVIRPDVTGMYLDMPLEKDFSTTLDKVLAGFGKLPVPPAVSARAGSGVESFLSALGIGLFEVGKITGYQRDKTDDGRVLHAVQAWSDVSKITARIDAKTNLLSDIAIEGTPTGAPKGLMISANVSFKPDVRTSAAGLVKFDPGKRKSVDTFAKLDPSQNDTGNAAPGFTLPTLDGKTVSLTDLKGYVVVIDFWATWCPPCRAALPKLDEFAKWAKKSGKKIKVFAVNTSERQPNVEQRKQSAAGFWKTKDYSVPVLLDLDYAVATSYHVEGLPTTIVIGPDGRIADKHVGFNPDMVNVLTKGALELLDKDD